MTTAPPASTTRRLLDDVVSNAGALHALLVARDGTLLGEGGDCAGLDTAALAALVAGMHAATREVARLVGEHQFSILLQQGSRRHLHVSLVDEAAMLVVVFEDQTRIGLVRLEARRAGDRLAPLLARQAAQAAEALPGVARPQFREFALGLIDSIFVARPT